MNTEIIQGTPEWFAIRCGKVTGSKIADVMSKGRGNAESAGVRNYRAQLVAERLTGKVEESFTNADMQRGIDLEPEARERYEFDRGVTVEQIGFVDHPSIEMAGCSPDGLLINHDDTFDDDAGIVEGLVEIKCPKTANHIDYILDGELPSKYKGQVQWQIACTGAQWCDFVSYDPTLPEHMKLFIVRVERDDEFIAEMEEKVISFIFRLGQMITDLDAACS